MNSLSRLEAVKLVWRKKLWLLLPAALGLTVAYLTARFTPPIYRASTLILVESPKVPANYVKATVTTNLQERLQTIEQQITSRGNLERIINEMNLHPDLVAEDQMAAAVARVRRDLSIEVRGGRIFRIYFRNGDPGKAAATANRIAALFIQENLNLRELQARSTSTFLESELEQIKSRLEEQERIVAEFRLSNEGRLPEQRESNLAAIAHLQSRLDINLGEIESAEMRKILLQRDEAAVEDDPELPSPRTRSQELRLELARLEAQYTDRHPDIVRLRREIESLEREASEIDRTDQAAAPPTDPVVQSQLRSADLDLERLRTERKRLLADVDLYRRRLEATPRVEQQLLILTRDYDNVEEAYKSLLEKRIDARLAENLERQRQSEQFRILEEALPPRRPYWPNLPLLLLAGFAAGVALGAGLILLRAQTRQTFEDLDSLQAAFPAVNAMAAIPLARGSVGGSRTGLRSRKGIAGG